MDARAARAADDLYRSHAREVYRYAYGVLGNRADAEDVTQTTFVNALRALERGEHPRKPSHWLISIAHNLIRQRFRQQRARPAEVELDTDVAAPETDDTGPTLDDLVRALQRLPEGQREALVLREIGGRSYREIAEILGLSVGALEALLFRARRALAEEIESAVTCDQVERDLAQQPGGRLSRKERRRIDEHIARCPSCSRLETTHARRRRVFKGLALVPLPLALTLVRGTRTASAATPLGTAAGPAAGGGGLTLAGGAAIKVAAVVAASAVVAAGAVTANELERRPAAPAASVSPGRPAARAHDDRTTASPRSLMPVARQATRTGSGRGAAAVRPEPSRSRAAPAPPARAVAGQASTTPHAPAAAGRRPVVPHPERPRPPRPARTARAHAGKPTAAAPGKPGSRAEETPARTPTGAHTPAAARVGPPAAGAAADLPPAPEPASPAPGGAGQPAEADVPRDAGSAPAPSGQGDRLLDVTRS